MAFNRTNVLLAYSLVRKYKDFTYELKDEQIEVLLNIANGEHTLAVLPTGFGKIDLFILAPLIMDMLDEDKPHYALVIVPLISLMSDIKENFELKGVEVCEFHSNQQLSADEAIRLEEGTYNVILVSPETIKNLPEFKRMFVEKPIYANGVCVLAVDEAHLLIQWGDHFRPAYRSIGELRSHFDRVPVLMTTATCPPDIRARMYDVMLFASHDEVKTVAVLPDRTNIMLSYHDKHPTAVEDALAWYLDEMQANGPTTRKAIIYCRLKRLI